MVHPSLKDYDFQISYGPSDDRLNQFYIPALSRSVQYDRSSGFFSSSALAIAATGIAHLIKNNGTMRLMVGAQLDAEDINAIQQGYDLTSKLTEKFLSSLDDIEELVKKRIEGLSWMIANGKLHIKVVLPQRNGIPLPANESHDYYHPKEGLFTDADGNRIGFSGSVNESEQSWQYNYEQFMVYRSWDATAPYLQQIKYRFESLWDGKEPYWIAMEIPDAVKAKLITFQPDSVPKTDPLEEPIPPISLNPDLKEQLIFQFFRDAPYLPNGDFLGQDTATVSLWPHQKQTVNEVVSKFPSSFLLCSEVGLGKTIEAGMALRKLIISGKVKRCLILTPKSVSRQWQEELYEKMALNIPLYDKGIFTDYFKKPLPLDTDNFWNSHQIFIASSQLAKRKEQQDKVLASAPWDLVIIDEAHHARRKDFLDDRRRPNRLLELIEGTKELSGLIQKTKCLFFLTATPMQVHPVEVWDLIKSLGLGGRWEASEDNYLNFFTELRKPFENVDWDFVLNMFKDSLASGTEIDSKFKELVESQLGPVIAGLVLSIHESTNRKSILKQLSPDARSFLVGMVKRYTPLTRLMRRSTRRLLRLYQEKGLLTDTVPERHPKSVWIDMHPDERALYDRIEEYISDFYHKYEDKKKGLGFVMTVYRRRLTSSFFAVKRSLERRLEFLKGKADIENLQGLTNEDVEEEDLSTDLTESIKEDPTLFEEEKIYVEDFLEEIRNLQGNSKWEQLAKDINEHLKVKESLVIFTQYTDTMDYLREQLRQVYGSQVACYSGRGGERWNGVDWTIVGKEEIKNSFRRRDEIKILLCTEAASEGLNLQTSGVLINYDMPWNPMRAEQRIGRIDRIGGHKDVYILNYFYSDTVEAKIYQALSKRIHWFEWVIGQLQPILSSVARTIQEIALTQRDQREVRLEEAIQELNKKCDEQSAAGLNLDEYLVEDPGLVKGQSPVTLKDLEISLTQSPTLKFYWERHPDYFSGWLLNLDGNKIPVTFDRELFDEHPETIRFITFGSDILEQILELVPVIKHCEQLNIPLIRCSVKEPQTLVGYYVIEKEKFTPVTSLKELQLVIDNQDVPSIDTDIMNQVEKDFLSKIQEISKEIDDRNHHDHNSKLTALEEKGRILLCSAAYCDFLKSQLLLGEDFLDGWNAPPDPQQVITSLRKKGFPFAPLLRFPELTKISLNLENSFFQKIRNKQDRELRSIEEGIIQEIKIVLKELVDLKEKRVKESSPEGMKIEYFFNEKIPMTNA